MMSEGYELDREALAGVLDVLDTPVIVHDKDAVLHLNAAARRMFRIPEGTTVTGLPFSRFVHPDGVAAGAERRRALFEHGTWIPRVRVKLLTFDGATLYCEGEARTVDVSDRRLVVTIASGDCEYVE